MSIGVAESYINDSLGSLARGPNGNRYPTWFGTPDGRRFNLVRSHFAAIRGKSSQTMYDCSTCSQLNVFAYVYPNQPGVVFLCPQFWKTNRFGTDSRAGTSIHEQTHFNVNGGTGDYAYGQPKCCELAGGNPDTAVMNADNHEYFAENNPAQA